MNRVFNSFESATQTVEQQQILFLWPDTISEEEDFLLGKKPDYIAEEEEE
jgi:hypothetical protein